MESEARVGREMARDYLLYDTDITHPPDSHLTYLHQEAGLTQPLPPRSSDVVKFVVHPGA